MNLNAGIISKNPELVKHSAGNPMFMNKFGDSWLCESCPFKKVCTDYQRRFKQPWTEEDEHREMKKIVEELREKFKIFFPSKPN